MPKVMFVVEHREVEVERGRRISDVASELGIQVCREEFAGTGIGDYTVWVEGAVGCLSPMTFGEKWLKGCKGQRRMANKAKILGDCKVWTQGGMSSRAVARPLAPAPRAGEDGSERFDHENDAAGTAWNPFGHPKAVGSGTRERAPYEPPQKKKRAPSKAAPAKAAPATSQDAEAEAADGDDDDAS